MPGIAIITGASQGIGRAIACRLARDGFKVALNDLPSQRSKLETLQGDLSRSGKESFISLADVSVEGEVKAMVDDVASNMGGLDVMVANAGICITKSLIETTKEDLERILSVNVNGTFLCYKYAALQMIKQGRGGRILGAASLASKQGWPFLGAYSSSKFAIRGLTQVAAQEFEKYGITVNAYAPGIVSTPMLQGILDSANDPKAGIEIKEKQALVNRLASADDVAGLASYLVSTEAAKITGQSVSINGGTFFD